MIDDRINTLLFRFLFLPLAGCSWSNFFYGYGRTISGDFFFPISLWHSAIHLFFQTTSKPSFTTSSTASSIVDSPVLSRVFCSF